MRLVVNVSIIIPVFFTKKYIAIGIDFIILIFLIIMNFKKVNTS